MLTSIELSGFKSFADRTRMDFSEGISVLVGPNGSGKSNIVDAIKWVLGEQSVKKLRGAEMADVIFGGSESRSAANLAEVTLTFENKNRFFSLEADEIHLTRRLYRNGESEYLINRQGTRLKDIRDLLTGSGLGTQAYSIIEQGRVELLLQSSALQRRGILEDAAGTALFNAKSQEALRRLERVEQNLLRLSDIVGEVESQLRHTKGQAGKAQQYRQYSTRIQTLRTEASLVQWRRRQSQSQALEEEIQTVGAECAALEAEVKRDEETRSDHAQRLEKADRALHAEESKLAAVREKTAGGESTVEFQWTQIAQLEKEITDHGGQLQSLRSRSGDAEEMIRKTSDEIFEVRKHHREITELFESHQAEFEKRSAECDELRSRLDEGRSVLQEQKLGRSRLAGEISGLEARAQSVRKTIEQRQGRIEELRAQMNEFLAKDGRLKGDSDEMAARLAERRGQIKTLEDEQRSATQNLALLRQEQQDQRQRLAATGERISVLTELVRRQEGLSPGVKEVLRQAADPSSPFHHVHGLVADLIRVNAEAAPLIESALGQTAQYLVVSPNKDLFALIESSSAKFSGRAGFMWLSPPPNDDHWKQGGEFDGLPGVLGRADRFVETEPEFAFLVYRLLGKTWIVENLRTAKALYRRSDGQTDFVTLSGESLLSNGTLLVGPSHTPSGLITRRTELRTLSDRKTEAEAAIAEKESQIAAGTAQTEEIERNLLREETEYRELQEGLDALRLQLTANQERDKRTQIEFDRLTDEIAELTKERNDIDAELERNRAEKGELESRTAELETTLAEARDRLTESDGKRLEESRLVTNLKIELAKSEERLDSLSDRQNQLSDSLGERKKLLKDHCRRLESLRKRRDAAEMTILTTESTLAELCHRREEIAEKRKTLATRLAEMSILMKETDKKLTDRHRRLSDAHERIRLSEMEVERIRQELKLLSDRMREDYGIDLPAESAKAETPASIPTERDRSETSAGTLDDALKEIETLKGKVRRLGSVNLEAIETLEHLETRFTTCSNQYNDLISARKSIQKIIERTNVHRQKLFEETFEAVKIYFCDIFQRLFGGGHADIIFEDPENPLESGIEIVARPPGKELKNVTLLSGGEKTLTCVAFLLAVFRHRACPICILDEVDAALDEVNVDRFNTVVRDFQTDTQFLLITHSKKTMTIAKSLYGVTMQDSGVSKLIAVQFDDVGDDGEILIQDAHPQPPCVPKEDSAAGAEDAA